MRKILLLGLLLAVSALLWYSWQTQPAAPDNPAYAAQVRRARQQKDSTFRIAPTSPIDSLQRPAFQGLRYYPPDAAYRVVARLTRAVVPTPVLLGQSNSRQPGNYVRFGTAEFELGGQPQRLVLLQQTGLAGANELFLPFADPTNGQQTYATGRFLDLPLPAANATDITLDFNAAYNPYCAYNHAYSCPIPPKENRLTVPVLAGEQTYQP